MSRQIKKIIPYLLILLVFSGVGFLSGTGKAEAQDTTKYCYDKNFFEKTKVSEADCKNPGDQWLTRAEAQKALADSRQQDPSKKRCYGENGFANTKTEAECLPPDVWRTAGEQAEATAPAADGRSEFEKLVNAKACISWNNFDMAGCMAKAAYYGLFQVAAFALMVAGRIFNFLISIAFDSRMFTDSAFIPKAWGIVRDLSNIFFILILLYVAIELILGIGSHGVKQMIAKVIVMALLINFSMFFTGIIIDTSNILALVFYNKIKVTHQDASGNTRNYPDPVAPNEKDASGGIVGYFNPTTLLTKEFLQSASEQQVGSVKVTNETGVSSGIILGIVLVSTAIMLFAAYAFFVAGFAFLGRLLELWILIIASPFAFMSYIVPQMSHIKDWGWNGWLKRLISAAFMAPAFMFFLYFIFMLIESTLFEGVAKQGSSQSFMGKIILFIIPAVLVLLLLLKSVKLAKASSGQFGETIMKWGGKMAGFAGGLALGAATGGAALLGTGVVGGLASKAAGSEGLKKTALEGKGFSKFGARMALRAANYGAGASFDIRQTGLGKFAQSKTGISLDKGLGVLGLGTKSFEGGRKKQIEHKAEEEEKRMKTYELSKSAAIEQKRKAEKWSEKYGNDLNEAKNEARNAGGTLDEKQFEKRYKAGEAIVVGTKTFQGSIKEKNDKEINAERRQAYANSLDKEGKEAAKSAVGAFFAEWAKGSAKMVTTPAGLAATAAASIIPGVGTATAIIGGGFLQAFKKVALGVTARNPEVVAAIRKGPGEYKELVDELKKMTEKGEGDKGKLSEIAKKMTGGGGEKGEETKH